MDVLILLYRFSGSITSDQISIANTFTSSLERHWNQRSLLNVIKLRYNDSMLKKRYGQELGLETVFNWEELNGSYERKLGRTDTAYCELFC